MRKHCQQFAAAQLGGPEEADAAGPRMEELEKQLRNLEARLAAIAPTRVDAPTTVTNNFGHQVTGNQINGNQINIVVNAFGRETREHLTPAFIEQCVRRTDKGLLQLLKMLHFSNDAPGNNNVKLASIKRGDMQVFDGERWSFHPRERVVTQMITAGHGIMQEHFDDHEDEIRARMRQSLFDYIQAWLNGIQNDEQQYVRPLVQDVLALIKTYARAEPARGEMSTNVYDE